jgi:enamine deaminase RidA (YjgF/YER057c/UK114 family)
MAGKHDVAKPLSRYAPFRRAGDLVIFAGITAADPDRGIVIRGYADLPPELRSQAGETGEMSTDLKDGPITAQSWFVLDRLRSTVATAGGTLDDVVKLTQYFCNLRDFQRSPCQVLSRSTGEHGGARGRAASDAGCPA